MDIIDFEQAKAARQSPQPSLMRTARIDGRLPVPRCGHHLALVDQIHRTLVCRECGSILDPLDWLLRLAVKAEILDTAYTEKTQQISQAQSTLANLKREIQRAKRDKEGLEALVKQLALQIRIDFQMEPAEALRKARELVR
jgi:hypothetical protein